MDKVWYIHAMEQYSAWRKNEIQMHTATWTNNNIMLNEISYTQKYNYYDSNYMRYLE